MNKRLIPILILVFLAIILIPIPELLLDILMGLVFVYTLMLFIIALLTKKIKNSLFLPKSLLIISIIGIILQICFTRSILANGKAFNGQIVRFISFLTAGSADNKNTIIAIIIFTVVTALNSFVVTKTAMSISIKTARFTLCTLSMKFLALEAEYSGKITEEEMLAKKDKLLKKTEFYESMDGASKFMAGSHKISLFITLIGVILSILIGIFYHKGNAVNAILIYIRLLLGNWLLAQLLILVELFIARILLTGGIKKHEHT